MKLAKFLMIFSITAGSMSSYCQTQDTMLSKSEAQAAAIAAIKIARPNVDQRVLVAQSCPGVMIIGRYFDQNSIDRLPLKKVLELIKGVPQSPDFDAAIYNCALRTETKVELAELKANSERMEGRELLVQGQGMYVAGSFFLKGSPGDMSPLLLNVDNVNSRQRTKFVKQCGDLTSECMVTVVGVARKHIGMPAVTASNLLLAD